MLSDVVAGEVLRRRRVAGLTRDELAARCTDLGFPMSTFVLANIETGRRDADGKRRRDVTVEEVVALGLALGVPPVLLLFPLGRQDTVNLTPELPQSTWDALLWFEGSHLIAANTGPLDEKSAQALAEELARATEPIGLFIRHADYVDRLDRAAQAGLSPVDDDVVKLENEIGSIRTRMRVVGLTPPPLPPGREHLDKIGPQR